MVDYRQTLENKGFETYLEGLVSGVKYNNEWHYLGLADRELKKYAEVILFYHLAKKLHKRFGVYFDFLYTEHPDG